MNTSNVTDMGCMFGYCTHLNNLDLSNFDVSKVTDIDRLFIGCSNLTSVCLPSNIKITIDFLTKINGVNYHWKDENGIVRETAVQNLSTPMTYTRYNGKAPSKTDTTTTPAKPTTPSTPEPTEPQKISVTSITLTGVSKKIAAGKSVTIKATAADGSDVSASYTIKVNKDSVKKIKLSAASKIVKAGKGKTVTITAASTDGSNKKAKIKIKIV